MHDETMESYDDLPQWLEEGDFVTEISRQIGQDVFTGDDGELHFMGEL